jgi:N6-adenosine-specific RNA methylase IME4
MGMGSKYFRNTTEHCLFATKGSVGIEDRGIRSHFEAPIGEHSAKPDMFYEIVRRASLAPYGEMFQRTKRPGFKNLHGPASKANGRH